MSFSENKELLEVLVRLENDHINFQQKLFCYQIERFSESYESNWTTFCFGLVLLWFEVGSIV